jgi:hypothetical protein
MHRTFRYVADSYALLMVLMVAQAPKYWQPHALRLPVLVFTIAVCWSLIALLEFLLWKSQQNNGLIFAPEINDLPLSDTFLYLYFPTILAVIFSIYWAWIDLETKRMEPYYQLSKENGALGKDSLLLQYPFSFIPLAPLRAFRDRYVKCFLLCFLSFNVAKIFRHWPVFWASFAVVIVTWGLVPTQAGIFSVRTVTRTTNTTFAVSTYSMPFEQQATSLSYSYMQSVYGIAVLNETLPQYMTRKYTLAPFEPSNSTTNNLVDKGNYTARTTMYNLNLSCEDVSRTSEPTFKLPRWIYYNSSSGCSYTRGLDGNATLGEGSEFGSLNAVKGYVGRYAGFYHGGSDSWSLDGYCPETANSTFYAAIAKSKVGFPVISDDKRLTVKVRGRDPPQNITAIYCQTRYWQQAVSATVDRQTREPLEVVPLGEKQPLPWYTFNKTNFEYLLNSGSLGVEIRADVLPTGMTPRYLESIAGTNMSLVAGISGSIQPMVGLALATPSRPMSDYLDWRVLSAAYLDAYQLLFARAMVDVLSTDSAVSNVTLSRIVRRQKDTGESMGQQQITSEAVVLEPVFVHIVAGFLFVVSIATAALLTLSLIRKRNIRTDPSTIASVMAIVADNEMLLSDFTDLDCCTEEDVEKVIAQKRYKLINDAAGTR